MLRSNPILHSMKNYLIIDVCASAEQVRYLRQKLKFATFERDLGLFLLRHRHVLPDMKSASKKKKK